MMCKIGLFLEKNLTKPMINFGLVTDGSYSPGSFNKERFHKSIDLRGISENGKDIEELVIQTNALAFMGNSSSNTELLEYALRKSQHVFLEKPPMIGEDEFRKLIELSGEAGTHIQIMNHLLHDSYIEELSSSTPRHISIKRQFERNESDAGLPEWEIFLDLQLISALGMGNISRHALNIIPDNSGPYSLIQLYAELDNGSSATAIYNRISDRTGHTANLYSMEEELEIDFSKSHGSSYEGIHQALDIFASNIENNASMMPGLDSYYLLYRHYSRIREKMNKIERKQLLI